MESDPIGLDGGITTYAYVGNIPLGFVDPLWLDPEMGYIEGNNNSVTVQSCSVVVFYGHGISSLDNSGRPVDWGSLTDKQKNKSDVPANVSNEQCSAAEVFGCNTGNYTDVEKPVPGASSPKRDVDGNMRSDKEALMRRARQAATRLCESAECKCKEIPIYFNDMLPWFQRTSNANRIEKIPCKNK